MTGRVEVEVGCRQVSEVVVPAQEDVCGRHDVCWVRDGELQGDIWHHCHEARERACEAGDVEEGCHCTGRHGCGRVVGTGVVLSASTDGDVG